MSKPKNMTPEQESAWREWHAKECRRRYLANREKILENQKRYLKENKEALKPKKAEWNKKWREKDYEQTLKREAEIRKSAKDRIRKARSKHAAKKKSQTAADSFFQLQAAAHQISTALETKPTT